MKKPILLLAIITVLTIQNHAQTVTDFDGNVYNTVTIGSQVWMKENLRVTHFRNGNDIPNVTDNLEWVNLTTSACCAYNNDYELISAYGLLYNWYTVTDSNNVAPEGWHIPTHSEWQTLETYLGGNNIAGAKMKEAGTTHWLSPNTGATNESGFTALPAGLRYYSTGNFQSLGYSCNMWSTNLFGSDSVATNCYLSNWSPEAINAYFFIKMGYSIRCLKDSTSSSVMNNEGENQMKLFPNPAKDIIFLNCINNSHLDLIIYSLTGDILLRKVLNSSKNEIDISSLKTGMYILKVKGADWTVQKKIIKE